ncbi:hypothetical protein [Rhodopirellula bahusiensis]
MAESRRDGRSYCLTGTPLPLAANVACTDYSVAKGGKLVAYQWDGEQVLSAKKFRWVETTPSFGLFGNAGDGAVSVGNMAHPVEVHRLCDHDEQPANPVEFRVELASAGVGAWLARWDRDLFDTPNLGLVVAEKTIERSNERYPRSFG